MQLQDATKYHKLIKAQQRRQQTNRGQLLLLVPCDLRVRFQADTTDTKSPCHATLHN